MKGLLAASFVLWVAACSADDRHLVGDALHTNDPASAHPVTSATSDAASPDEHTLLATTADADPPSDAATQATAPADGTNAPDDTLPTGPLGTFDNPIVVAPLPFIDARDTAHAPGGVFTLYNCEPGTTEGGDGFVYRLDIAVHGVVEARLDDVPGDGVDVDVHLLTAANADACLVRDNLALSFAVEPGTYWIVVDTWVNAAGKALPGPYTLTVTFASDTATDAPGTLQNPILVADFPFSDARDTVDAPGAEFDAYSCAAGTDEGGGEFVYRVLLPSAGMLAVSLDDRVGDGVDVDVHLLGSPQAGDCRARGNISFVQTLDAGVYYVVVDTWVDADGDAQAGPYVLTIDFTPDHTIPTTTGTLADPIRVGSFPFHDASTTALATSSSLDAYGCQPDSDQGGHEVIYSLSIPAPGGVLTASIDDRVGDGVDLDLHLLRGENPATDCLARDNRSIAAEVSAGTYLLVVDTWVDGGGTPMPGAYQLDVDLLPKPDFTLGCLVIYGDTRSEYTGDPQVAHRAVVASIVARCPAGSTSVHTGDLVRSGSNEEDWSLFVEIETPLRGPTRRLFPTRGNHDGRWSDITSHLATMMPEGLSDSQYVRQLWPHLWLIAMDSELDPQQGASFLRAALEDPARAGDKFLIAFHKPLYPSVGGHSGWADGKSAWGPIFRDHARRIVVATGHNHGLARENMDGATFVTAGGGGAPLYGCTQAHDGTRFCSNNYGYFACDPLLRCAAFELDPVTRVEKLRDAFRIP